MTLCFSVHDLIESDIPVGLLASLYSSQVVTKGDKHLLNQNRFYYKMVNQLVDEGQRRGQAARQAQERYLLADGAKERAHALRDHLERAFLNAQAGLLAEGLTDGTPCPVCGEISAAKFCPHCGAPMGE